MRTVESGVQRCREPSPRPAGADDHAAAAGRYRSAREVGVSASNRRAVATCGPSARANTRGTSSSAGTSSAGVRAHRPSLRTRTTPTSPVARRLASAARRRRSSRRESIAYPRRTEPTRRRARAADAAAHARAARARRSETGSTDERPARGLTKPKLPSCQHGRSVRTHGLGAERRAARRMHRDDFDDIGCPHSQQLNAVRRDDSIFLHDAARSQCSFGAILSSRCTVGRFRSGPYPECGLLLRNAAAPPRKPEDESHVAEQVMKRAPKCLTEKDTPRQRRD
jgi:hypothetical protein